MEKHVNEMGNGRLDF